MRVAVGLSGGVDSSVTALLLKEQGYDVVGITMKLWREGGRYHGGEYESCFGPGEEKNIAIAAALAKKLDIPYEVFDCSAEYEKHILDYVRDTYRAGRTPNPCVKCNELMKFGLLPELAQKAGLKFDKFTTGHYARVAFNEATGRYEIKRAKDESKDQSYFLYRLSQAQLKRHLFPMGELTKKEAREIAHKFGLAAADRPDSQDFYSGEISEIINLPPKVGNVVTTEGKVIGTHQGYWNYTIGQRKGLGIGGGTPFYVVDLNACKNEVIVGTRVDADVKDFDLVQETIVYGALDTLKGVPTSSDGLQAVKGLIKVRSAGSPKGPIMYENGHIHAEGGIFGVAPGQSAVIYDLTGETILLGGIIK